VADDPQIAFKDVSVAMLVGARPRTGDMQRSDLLAANGAIFAEHGSAIDKAAAQDVRVLVVGNPANTNALIAMNNAPNVPRSRFTALTRLDHNRAVAQLARRVRVSAADVARVAIWGNHSATQYPDLFHATVAGRSALDAVDDMAWVRDDFIPTVQERGTSIIAARGASSAASAASAAIDHVHDWIQGTPAGDWTSMAVCSDGSYGVPAGLISSFPVACAGGEHAIVPGLEISEFSRVRIDATVAELAAERAAVAGLGFA
jgi:malate dehydrogenase